ncbi:hypothetical protein ACSSS7_004146 [Eimeria intestinalis]
MVLRTQTAAGTKVYDLSAFGGGVSVFERQRDKNRRKKTNQLPQDDVILLQDFEFPVASNCIQVSADGNFIGAAGVYPPQMRVYSVHGLGLKFQRGLDSEPIDLRFLSSDYTKIALLERGRWIELHGQGGRHHRLRIPSEGTSLTYVEWSATLFSSSSSSSKSSSSKSKLYALDLESGSFLEPWQTVSSIGYCCFHSELLPIVAVGETGGRVECFDARSGKAVALLRATDRESAITAGAFSPDSLEVAVGTSSGKCLIFDLRQSRPLLQFEHRNFSAVNTLQWLRSPSAAASAAAASEDAPATTTATAATAATTAGAGGPAPTVADAAVGGRRVASCDGVSIKVWAASAANCLGPHARLLASIEAPVVWENPIAPRNEKQQQQQQQQQQKQQQQRVVRFSSFSFYGDSGLVVASTDHKQMAAYFLPSIGLAPKWCPMLDGLTEELEEQQQKGDGSAAVSASSYATLQFLTEQQMQQLNAHQLIGTPLVTRYLHGYFISRDLYAQLKAAAEPFAFEVYRQQKIEERLEKKKPMRIQVRRKLPKTNAEFADKLQKILESTDKNASKREKRQAAVAAGLLQDDRFSRLFTNPDFQLEQEEQ